MHTNVFLSKDFEPLLSCPEIQIFLQADISVQIGLPSVLFSKVGLHLFPSEYAKNIAFFQPQKRPPSKNRRSGVTTLSANFASNLSAVQEQEEDGIEIVSPLVSESKKVEFSEEILEKPTLRRHEGIRRKSLIMTGISKFRKMSFRKSSKTVQNEDEVDNEESQVLLRKTR